MGEIGLQVRERYGNRTGVIRRALPPIFGCCDENSQLPFERQTGTPTLTMKLPRSVIHPTRVCTTGSGSFFSFGVPRPSANLR